MVEKRDERPCKEGNGSLLGKLDEANDEITMLRKLLSEKMLCALVAMWVLWEVGGASVTLEKTLVGT